MKDKISTHVKGISIVVCFHTWKSGSSDYVEKVVEFSPFLFSREKKGKGREGGKWKQIVPPSHTTWVNV